MKSASIKKTTLCFLVGKNEILLAMKKRGFGEGKWNGVGGKVQTNETVEDATKRETQEEIGVAIQNLEKVAELLFTFEDEFHEDWNQLVLVYFCTKWKGVPTESEEMRPHWYKKSKIPFEEMWEDDRYWIPMVLEGKKIKGEFLFDCNQKLISHSIKEVSHLKFSA